MKKQIVAVLVALAMMFTSAGVVFAAPNTAGYPTLQSVIYVPVKGPVFTFSVSGKLSKADLKGYVHVNGGADFDLYCVQVDEGTVKCSAPKAVEDVNVVVHLGIYVFWTYVPPARLPSPSEYCYSVWDYDEFGVWHDFGPYCQSSPAGYGDTVTLDVNPYFPGSWVYVFMPEGLPCVDIVGDAYYFCEGVD